MVLDLLTTALAALVLAQSVTAQGPSGLCGDSGDIAIGILHLESPSVVSLMDDFGVIWHTVMISVSLLSRRSPLY